MNISAHALSNTENPLLAALGPFRTCAELSPMLRYSPLDGVEVADLDEESRTSYLSLIDKHFVPTMSAMEIATNIQAMLRGGYVQRNPYVVATRRSLYDLGAGLWKGLADLPAFDTSASGFTVAGVTGMGKTTEIARILSLFPQVVDHGPNKRAGWAHQRQLVWLYVEMPHDGSRSGLLAGILSALDKVLGTDDMEDIIRKFRRLDEREVAVATKLASCYCGILVLDEAQRGNFTSSPHSRVLQLFFLKLMNMGIPLVFSGNPQALTPLIGHAQNIRRFCSEGFMLMEPAPDEADEDWDEHLVPGMWDYSVMPRATPLTREIQDKLKLYSGGMRGLLRQVIKGSQKTALWSRADAVTEDHLDRYYNSLEMQLNHDLIKGFRTKDAGLLKRYKDIPAEYYEQLWKNENSPDQGNAAAGEHSITADTGHKHIDRGKKERARVKSQETRKNREEERIRDLQKSLLVDDLRATTAPAAHIAAFNALSDE